MTAIAQDRSGIGLNQEAFRELREITGKTHEEDVENRFSGRTEKRTTYYLNGLNLCTIVRDNGKVVEIQSGLMHHPVVGRLTK